jgi:hypothetical protein
VQSGTGEFDCFDYFYMLGSIADAGALVDLTDWIGIQQDLDTAVHRSTQATVSVSLPPPRTAIRHWRWSSG